LVVDDTREMLLLLEGYLREFGYSQVSTAQSANIAIKYLAENAKSPPEEAIDLILMDVNMPGIDGIEACRRIKMDPNFMDLQIIVVSANDDTDHLIRASDAGAMDYVTKPLKRLELQAQVRSALTLKHAIDSEKRTNAVLNRTNEELTEALANVKLLKGLLPICASCKNIRNDSGYWSGIEAYIVEHTEADFSHAICPDCIKKIYPCISQEIIDELSETSG